MVYTRENYIPTELHCPHCQKKNPVRALACEHCHQQIHQKSKGSIWKTQLFQGTRPVVLLGVLICITGLMGIQRLIEIAERHLNNINSQNQKYLDSLHPVRAQPARSDTASNTQ